MRKHWSGFGHQPEIFDEYIAAYKRGYNK